MDFYFVRYVYQLFPRIKLFKLKEQSIDTWVFNAPALRGVGLTNGDWKMLSEVGKFLEVRKVIMPS